MKKLLLFGFLLFPIISFSAAGTTTAASLAIISAANAARIAQEQNQMTKNIVMNNQRKIPKGVLFCSAHQNYTQDGYLYNGCKRSTGAFSSENIPLEDFFEQHKPKEATKITMIIFDNSHNMFEIYYS